MLATRPSQRTGISAAELGAPVNSWASQGTVTFPETPSVVVRHEYPVQRRPALADRDDPSCCPRPKAVAGAPIVIGR